MSGRRWLPTKTKIASIVITRKAAQAAKITWLRLSRVLLFIMTIAPDFTRLVVTCHSGRVEVAC